MLSESYKNRIQELGGILLEKDNRDAIINKLGLSQEIADWSHNLSDKLSIWIANQVKENPNLYPNSEGDFKRIVSWIQNNPSENIKNLSFEKALEITSAWEKEEERIKGLEKMGRIDGGEIVINYGNGWMWVKVDDVNYCMLVGEERGWCFKSEERAFDFVFGSNGGYFLINPQKKAEMAIEYNPNNKTVNDYQGDHNEIPTEKEALMSMDLFKTFPKIKNINSHKGTFNNVLKKYHKVKKIFVSLNNLDFDIEAKFKLGLELTDEELRKLSFKFRLHNGLKIFDDELQNLDLTKNFVNKLMAVVYGKKNPREVFSEQDFEPYAFELEDNKFILYMDEYEFEKNFFLEESAQNFIDYVNSYNFYIDNEEYEYFHYYINDNTKQIINKILSFFGKNYEEMKIGDHEIFDFISKTFPKYENEIRYKFQPKYSDGIQKNLQIEIKNILENEIKFPYNYSINGVGFEYAELLKEIVKKAHNIEKIKNLKDLIENFQFVDITADSLYDLEYEVGMYPKVESELQEDLEEVFEGLLEEIESGEYEVFTSFFNRLEQIKKDLGFVGNEVRYGNREIYILRTFPETNQIEINYTEYYPEGGRKAGEKKIINIENLATHLQNEKLFEFRKKIRQQIVNILKEDFRFDNSNISLIPTDSMAKNAQIALSAIEKNNLLPKGENEGSGREKASKLINKEPINHSQLKRMKAFFDNNETAIIQEKNVGKNVNNSGLIQSWMLWGGDAGKVWVNQKIDYIKSRNLARKDLRRNSGMLKTSTLMDPYNTRIKR